MKLHEVANAIKDSIVEFIALNHDLDEDEVARNAVVLSYYVTELAKRWADGRGLDIKKAVERSKIATENWMLLRAQVESKRAIRSRDMRQLRKFLTKGDSMERETYLERIAAAESPELPPEGEPALEPIEESPEDQQTPPRPSEVPPVPLDLPDQTDDESDAEESTPSEPPARDAGGVRPWRREQIPLLEQEQKESVPPTTPAAGGTEPRPTPPPSSE